MKNFLATLALLLVSSLTWGQSPNPYVTVAGKLQGPNGLPAQNQIISFTPTQTFFVAGLGASSCDSYTVEINGTALVCGDTINFNNLTPAAPTNGLNVQFQTSKTGGVDSVSAALVGNGNVADCLSGIGTYVACSGGGSGGGNPTLDNCTPDESGNSFYSVTSLTNYFYAGWQFIFNTTTYINCTVYIPTAQSGATIVLDIATSDNTAGHTASFQTCDGVINSGTINLASSLTCASGQTFTTTSTAYNRVTLTFNVQSTLSNGSMLAVKIGVSPSGTAPTANLLMYPHFVL